MSTKSGEAQSVPDWGLVGIRASFDGLIDRETFDRVQAHLIRREHTAHTHVSERPEFPLWN